MITGRVADGGSAAFLPSARVVDLSARRLLAAGSPLADDVDVWKACSGQAAAVVEDCVRSMDRNSVTIDNHGATGAAAVGALMLERGVDVLDALRAGAVLCEVVADVLAEDPAPCGERRWLGLRAAQRSVALRVEAFATSYIALLAARDQQRRRDDRQLLARELHDYVGANISLARRQLELHRLYSDRDRASAEHKVEAAERVLQDVLGGTRRLLQDLRAQPPVSGLSLALLTFVTSTAPDAEVDVRVVGDEGSLGDTQRHEVYLICQEGLRNAFAHARARHVSVRVRINEAGVEAVVQDDGRGFDVSGVVRNPEPGHHGLAGMRERAESLGGAFELTSVPGGGTRAVARMPVRPQERSA